MPAFNSPKLSASLARAAAAAESAARSRSNQQLTPGRAAMAALKPGQQNVLPVGVKQPGKPGSPGMSSPDISPKPTTPSPGYTGLGGNTSMVGENNTYKAGETRNGVTAPTMPKMKKGGMVKSKQPTKFSSGGSTNSASKRGDGIAQRGKTKGKMC